MSHETYKEKYLTPNAVYQTFYPEWEQNQKSYHGGITYRHGGYLRAYSIDAQTPSETITTYDYVDGQQVGVVKGTRVSSWHQWEPAITWKVVASTVRRWHQSQYTTTSN